MDQSQVLMQELGAGGRLDWKAQVGVIRCVCALCLVAVWVCVSWLCAPFLWFCFSFLSALACGCRRLFMWVYITTARFRRVYLHPHAWTRLFCVRFVFTVPFTCAPYVHVNAVRRWLFRLLHLPQCFLSLTSRHSLGTSTMSSLSANNVHWRRLYVRAPCMCRTVITMRTFADTPTGTANNEAQPSFPRISWGNDCIASCIPSSWHAHHGPLSP